MKHIILTTILTLGLMSIFTGCERNDYQHPGYRSK
jgi:hypothetical protein